jgi:hypothetical protein
MYCPCSSLPNNELKLRILAILFAMHDNCKIEVAVKFAGTLLKMYQSSRAEIKVRPLIGQIRFTLLVEKKLVERLSIKEDDFVGVLLKGID